MPRTRTRTSQPHSLWSSLRAAVHVPDMPHNPCADDGGEIPRGGSVHEQNRLVEVLEHRVGSTPEDDFASPRAAVGTHDHEVGAALLGGGRERLRDGWRAGGTTRTSASIPATCRATWPIASASPSSRFATLTKTTRRAAANSGAATVTTPPVLAESFQHTMMVSVRVRGAVVAATRIGRPHFGRETPACTETVPASVPRAR